MLRPPGARDLHAARRRNTNPTAYAPRDPQPRSPVWRRAEWTIGHMVLSDRSIKEELASGRLIIDPIDHDLDVQPASVDVHLDRVFRVFKVSSRPYIDIRKPSENSTKPRQTLSSSGRGHSQTISGHIK